MESSELRIGNLVLNKFNNETIEIESVGNDGINLYSQGDYENHHYLDCEFRLSDISPIPLTEDWLIKFGFEKFDNFGHYDSFSLKSDELNLATIEFDSKNGVCWLCFEGTQCGIDIQYIHQLQNLYFALTGNELSIINP